MSYVYFLATVLSTMNLDILLISHTVFKHLVGIKIQMQSAAYYQIGLLKGLRWNFSTLIWLNTSKKVKKEGFYSNATE